MVDIESIQQCYCSGDWDSSTNTCNGTSYWPDNTGDSPNIFRGVGVLCEQGTCDCTNVERACCILNESTGFYSCNDFTPQECIDLGGESYPDQLCEDSPCPGPQEPKGACCRCNGDCSFVDEFTCENVYNGYWVQDADCETPNVCDNATFGPLGSCCYSNGTCTSGVYECECISPAYWTEGEECDPPCVPEVGSCCTQDEGNSTGECFDNDGAGVLENECDGIWYRDVYCDLNPCTLTTFECIPGAGTSTIAQWVIERWGPNGYQEAFETDQEALDWADSQGYVLDMQTGPAPNYTINGPSETSRLVGGCILPISYKIYGDVISDNTDPVWDGTSCSKFGAKRFPSDEYKAVAPYDRYIDPAKMGAYGFFYPPLKFRRGDGGGVTPNEVKDITPKINDHTGFKSTREWVDALVCREGDPDYSNPGCVPDGLLSTVFYHRYATYVPFGQKWGPHEVEASFGVSNPQQCDGDNESYNPETNECRRTFERDVNVCPREIAILDGDFSVEHNNQQYYGGGPSGTLTIDTPEQCEGLGGYVTNYTPHGGYRIGSVNNQRANRVVGDPETALLSTSPYDSDVGKMDIGWEQQDWQDGGALEYSFNYPRFERREAEVVAIKHADFVINYNKGPLYIEHQLGSDSVLVPDAKDDSGLKWIHSYPFESVRCAEGDGCIQFNPDEFCLSSCCGDEGCRDYTSPLGNPIGSDYACYNPSTDEEIPCCPTTNSKEPIYMGYPMEVSQLIGNRWSENAIKGNLRGHHECSTCLSCNESYNAPHECSATCSPTGWVNISNNDRVADIDEVSDYWHWNGSVWGYGISHIYLEDQTDLAGRPHGWDKELDREPFWSERQTEGFQEDADFAGGVYGGNKGSHFSHTWGSAYRVAGTVALPGGRKSATGVCNAEFAKAVGGIDYANIGPKTGWNSGISDAGQPNHTHRLGHAGTIVAQGNPCECCGDASTIVGDPDYGLQRPGCVENIYCCQPLWDLNLDGDLEFVGLNCNEDITCDNIGDNEECAEVLHEYPTDPDSNGSVYTIEAGKCVNISELGYSPCCPSGCRNNDDLGDGWTDPNIIIIKSNRSNRTFYTTSEYDQTISEHISDVNYTLWFFDDK